LLQYSFFIINLIERILLYRLNVVIVTISIFHEYQREVITKKKMSE